MLKRLLIACSLWLAASATAFAQSGQLPSGWISGNAKANPSPASPAAITAILDRALGAVNMTFVARWSGLWGAGTFGTGLALSGSGVLNLQPSAAGTIGGVNSIAQVAHQWVQYIDTAGLPHLTQPAFGDISGQATFAQLPSGTTDTLLGYWGTTVLGPLAVNNCAGALTYSTSTHTFGCNSAAGTGTVTSAAYTNSTGMAVSGTTPCTVTCSWTFAISKATASNVYAGTSNQVLTSDIVYTPEVTVTFSTTPTFDFSTFINSVITLTGNISSITAANIKAGQAGTLTFIQDATGSRTLPATFSSNFKFAGGVQPVLSTAPNAVDVIFYSCRSTSYCLASIGKAFN